MTKDIGQIQLEKLEEYANESYELLLNRKKEQFNYYLFLGAFLPYFIGEKDMNSNNIRSKWIKIAKSPYNEVDLIDDDGSYIATVPPLMDLNANTTVEPRKIDNAFLTYEISKDKSIPGVAKRNLLNDLENATKKAESSFRERWITFLKHCKEDRDRIKGSDTSTPKNKEVDNKASKKEVIQYDEDDIFDD